MCLLWRSPTIRSPETTSGDFIFNLAIADSGKLEIGTRQFNNWRLREPPDFLPFCQPGALPTRLYCSRMPRHHSRLPGRYNHHHHRHSSRTSQSSYGYHEEIEWKRHHNHEERRQHVAKPYLPFVKLPSFSGEGDPNVYLGWEAKVAKFFMYMRS